MELWKASDIKMKQWYGIASILFLATAWFSVGFNHFDEHFQILEFAGLKLGLTEKANLPWEYGCQMRPAVQPLVVYLICKSLAFIGIENPFVLAFFIRLFSATLTFLSIHLIIRLYAPELKNSTILKWFVLLSFFLWFVPYNSARFSSETAAGRIFLIGVAVFFLSKKNGPVNYLLTGLILGISFITRYQVAFLIVGFAAWLLIIRRTGVINLCAFAAGVLSAIAAGIVADRWFYGQWVLTSWNYLYQNLFLGKASGFGVSPWWYYIEQTFLNAFPPLSILYISAVFLYFILFPKDILTWAAVPFLLVHFIIPHKEIRFLFPIIGFLPIMIIRVADYFLKQKNYELLQKRIFKISVKTFWILNNIMLIVLIFRPADEQIPLYKQLWNSYPGPVKLYFTDENPYHRANVDIYFYKRPGLVFNHIDSVQQVVPSGGDTTDLIVRTKPGMEEIATLHPVLIYRSYPAWLIYFNINHWIERTSMWYVYRLNKESNDK